MSGKHVVLYTSNPCGQCDEVRELLDSWDVRYEERSITSNPENLELMQDKGVYGTPVTFVEEDIILGVQKDKLKKRISA